MNRTRIMLSVGTAVLIVGIILSLKSTSAHKAESGDQVLEKAALNRLKNDVKLRLQDGQEVSPRDPKHAVAMKVDLFKRLLANDAARNNPSFKEQVEKSLLEKHPAEISIKWDDETGNQEMTFVAENTSNCALPLSGHIRLKSRDLWKHQCLKRISTQDRLEAITQELTVDVTTITPGNYKWKELSHEEEKLVASQAFIVAHQNEP